MVGAVGKRIGDMKGLESGCEYIDVCVGERGRTANLDGTFRRESRRLWMCLARGGMVDRWLAGAGRSLGYGRG